MKLTLLKSGAESGERRGIRQRLFKLQSYLNFFKYYANQDIIFYKKIYIREKTNIRLELKGVSHTADVFFDANFLVHHYNAYTGFAGIVKDVEAGEHEFKVCVDHSFYEASALHVPNDYETYGGVIRPVVLEEIGDLYIKNVHFTP
ncbi:MAG: hypothetical protein K2H38_02925, partial [Muribaculaceae bacterium]|nr:hypothetical protein [Muribaculaceae bacterium]